MYPHADIDVWAPICRHGLTDANVQRTNFGNRARLTETGIEQTKLLFRHLIDDLKARVILCSEADRTFCALIEEIYPGFAIIPSPLFNEWKRPAYTINKPNDDPEVAKMLRKRREGFGPGYVPQDGEETFEKFATRIERGLNFIRATATNFETKMVPVLMHGLLARHYFNRMVLGVCDEDRMPPLFRDLYGRTGFANAGIMHSWYGFEYGTRRKGWNVEIADVSYLPPELRHKYI
jgi:broad specificity phosphatase PhoE